MWLVVFGSFWLIIVYNFLLEVQGEVLTDLNFIILVTFSLLVSLLLTEFRTRRLYENFVKEEIRQINHLYKVSVHEAVSNIFTFLTTSPEILSNDKMIFLVGEIRYRLLSGMYKKENYRNLQEYLRPFKGVIPKEYENLFDIFYDLFDNLCYPIQYRLFPKLSVDRLRGFEEDPHNLPKDLIYFIKEIITIERLLKETLQKIDGEICRLKEERIAQEIDFPSDKDVLPEYHEKNDFDQKSPAEIHGIRDSGVEESG